MENNYEPIEPEFFRNPNTENDSLKRPSNRTLFIFIICLLIFGAAYSYFAFKDGVLPPIALPEYSEIPFINVVSPDNSFPGNTAIPSSPASASEEEVCIQVIVKASNPQTGEIREFPTPCDVPEGWISI
jgi:hypothetical protein